MRGRAPSTEANIATRLPSLRESSCLCRAAQKCSLLWGSPTATGACRGGPGEAGREERAAGALAELGVARTPRVFAEGKGPRLWCVRLLLLQSSSPKPPCVLYHAHDGPDFLSFTLPRPQGVGITVGLLHRSEDTGVNAQGHRTSTRWSQDPNSGWRGLETNSQMHCTFLEWTLECRDLTGTTGDIRFWDSEQVIVGDYQG